MVISRLSLRPPHREMAMDGRSLRLSEVLSTPLSMPELPTDCGDGLADRAPLWLVCLASPGGSPLRGGREVLTSHTASDSRHALARSVAHWVISGPGHLRTGTKTDK